MKLSDIYDSPCGIGFYLDSLHFSSGTGRKALLERNFMTARGEIEGRYRVLSLFSSKIVCDAGVLLRIQDALRPLKDLSVTLKRISVGAVPDETELFEIKRTALIWEQVRKLLNDAAGIISELGTGNGLDDLIDILDPEKQRIVSFYLYDCYSDGLADVRKKLKASPDDAELRAAEKDEERKVLSDLAEKIRPMLKSVGEASVSLSEIDICCAAADYMQHDSFCIPTVSDDGKCMIVGYSNPQVESLVVKGGGTYQYCDILFSRGTPTVVIGSNMGGKSVTLRTVALCQYLFQFALPVPACNARLSIQDKIYLVTPEERPSSALSSFGNEMKGIDTMLRGTANGEAALALLDEPCRSTNPVEGGAMVDALVELTAGRKNVTMILATHYRISPSVRCRWLRVTGLENGKMNYALVESSDREIPHEALNVAARLGVTEEWLSLASKILNNK